MLPGRVLRALVLLGLSIVCWSQEQPPSAAEVLTLEQGLTVATFVTLLLVPTLYAIFVDDLKLVKWETRESHPPSWGAITCGRAGSG